jgi:hypothetical protein
MVPAFFHVQLDENFHVNSIQIKFFTVDFNIDSIQLGAFKTLAKYSG